MVQGREFTDFEQDFIAYVTRHIQKGTFHTLLQDTGADMEKLIEALEMTELYDCDYLDIQGELNADKIFPVASIRNEVLHTLGITEAITVRISVDTTEKQILFMSIGESQLPGMPYTCYAFGFITQDKNGEECYYFQSLMRMA